MDTNPISTSAAASTSTDDADDWDTEGFVVPSVLTANSDAGAGENPPVTISAESANPTNTQANKNGEEIQLEPEGMSSNYTKQQQNLSSTGLDNSTTIHAGTSRRQKLKHKLREADKKFVGENNGRENKIESLREIMGGGKQMNNTHGGKKGSSRDWLDPHCNESEFDRRSS